MGLWSEIFFNPKTIKKTWEDFPLIYFAVISGILAQHFLSTDEISLGKVLVTLVISFIVMAFLMLAYWGLSILIRRH